jgi:carbon-monoxide dehydrogenase small subunit
MAQLTMTVNGNLVSGQAEGRTLLVQFLRGELGLTGTHVGCDTSQCGACVVHVNGAAVKACAMFTAEAAGAEVSRLRGRQMPMARLTWSSRPFRISTVCNVAFAPREW